MHGCPTLENLELCEYDPEQSWCMTNQPACKQQAGDGGVGVGEGWAYCSPGIPEANVQPSTELPICTCKSSWKFAEGICANNPISVKGCPTVEQMKLCMVDFEEDDQPWCDTNEEYCREQEDDIAGTELMKWEGWSYCNPDTQETELPVCECESRWTANCSDGRNHTFLGCPAVERMQECDPTYTSEDTETWCDTKYERCREQTYHVRDPTENMVGEGWAICNPATNEAVWPECECLSSWTHEEGKCEDHPFTYHGCPSQNALARCDYDATVNQAWCDTTYATCEQQNYEADGEGWSYCNPSSGDAELAECECKDMWKNREDSCDPFAGNQPQKMRGCPSLDRIQQCEPDATESWCDTKDNYCLEQTAQNKGDGWVVCDPHTQWAIDKSEGSEEVGGVIATSVAVTFLVCALIVVGLLFAYRKYMHGHKEAYTELSQKRLVETYVGGP